ncbi:MAG: HEAT repeat domain-containing protein [Candidatus Omnitrophica bacterium]|nr:HEAT repeat domain-containing protein [Candidatus Omnitrophota bacterium]
MALSLAGALPCFALSKSYESIPLAIRLYDARYVVHGLVISVQTTERTKWDLFQVCEVSVLEVLRGDLGKETVRVPSVNNNVTEGQRYVFILDQQMIATPERYRSIGKLFQSVEPEAPETLKRVRELLAFEQQFKEQTETFEGTLALLQHDNEDARVGALHIIDKTYASKYSTTEISKRLLPILQQADTSETAKSAVLGILQRIHRGGEKDLQHKKALTETLQIMFLNEDETLRWSSWAVLRLLDAERALDFLVEQLEKSDPTIDRHAILYQVYSGFSGNPEMLLPRAAVFQAIVQGEESDQVRALAAEILSDIHTEEHLALWISLLDDSERNIRLRALSVLTGYQSPYKALADRSLIPMLQDMRRKESDHYIQQQLDEILSNPDQYFKKIR